MTDPLGARAASRPPPVSRTADEELRADERRYRSLVEATTSIVWRADPRRGFTAPQPSWEEYTGQRFEEYRGFGWVASLHPEERDRIAGAWRTASARSEVFEVEGRLWHAPSGRYRWCLSRGAPVLDDAGRVVEWVGTCTDVDERVTAREEAARASAARLVAEQAARRAAEEAAERAERMARVVRSLSGAMTEEEVAAVLAAELSPSLGADAFVLQLAADGGTGLRPVGTEGDGDGSATLPRVPATPGRGPADAFLSGRPVFVESADEYGPPPPEAAAGRPASTVGAWADLPLTAADTTQGVLHVGFSEARRFEPAERAFLVTVGNVAAEAIRRARLLRAEQDARCQAEAAAGRLRRLQEISDVALSRLSTGDLVAALCDRIRDLLGVDVVRILLVAEDDPAVLRPAAEPAGQPAGVAGFSVRVGRGFAGRVAAAGTALIEADPPAADEPDPLVGRLRAVAGVPLLVGRRLVGVLHVGTAVPRDFDEADVELLELAAERIALALDRSRAFEVQREMARTLQAALLPPSLPAVPHLALAARYIAAGEATDVGGDFYDVFRAASGAWLAVVGDVCGRGAEAAAMTGLARHTIRAVAQETDSPVEILGRLNTTLAVEGGDERFATAVCVRLEPTAGESAVSLTSGGHARPVIVRAGGRAEAVAVRGTMLGPFPEVHLEEVVSRLGVGDSLVLYTDGVVEARGADGLFGEDRLLEVLAAHARGTATELAGAVEQAVWAHSAGGPADDLAVLVVQVPPTWSGDLVLDERLPSGDLAPRAGRRALDQALSGRIPAEVVDAARLAVSELVTNAVRHGDPGRPGETGPGLRILLSETMLRLEVRNRGRRFSFRHRPAGPLTDSGRGLDVVRAVATSAGIDEEGTTVTVWCTFSLGPAS